MHYYERLKQTREDLDMSQEEVAGIIETSQTQMWRYETGKNEMTVSKLRQLCLLYHVSADYILGLPRGLDWPR
ncbi:helix-turn-helix transcriptional regulator [uncultured Pseudoflavonifractor sp.]|uniref:helix-turn-helix domain-containing protein n=1 Tax=uncultured Pseudoflavonifractor sp. TaxID=1221379 RepID=UPI0025F22E71|nr:helix-turn-helix transcriptional regulator [uncultured Pseudoflavonifractor sp.]